MFRTARAVSKAPPINPPASPPAACSAIHVATPPHAVKACVVMIRVPIIRPASAADSTEMTTRVAAVKNRCLNILLYPKRLVSRSKNRLAAVNPRKYTPLGLSIRLKTVAMAPTAVATPGFRIHHDVRLRAAKPITSQKIGNRNTWKTMGANSPFSTPHRLESMTIAVSSRLLKYVKASTRLMVLLYCQIVTPRIKSLRYQISFTEEV